MIHEKTTADRRNYPPAALAATVLVQPVVAGDSGVTIATGSVTIVGSQIGLPNGTNRTFSFVVVQLPNGQITGQAQVITFGGIIGHMAIDCFSLSGNQAIIGGTVTSSSNPDVVGLTSAFAVQDNPDVITFLFTGPDTTCENLLSEIGQADITGAVNEFGIPVESGNVMIRQAN
jgi:hypothetical protein